MSANSRRLAWIQIGVLFLVDLTLMYAPAVLTTGAWVGARSNVVTEHMTRGLWAHYGLVALGFVLTGICAGLLTRRSSAVVGGLPLAVFLSLHVVEACLGAESSHTLFGFEVIFMALATAPQGLAFILVRALRHRWAQSQDIQHTHDESSAQVCRRP